MTASRVSTFAALLLLCIGCGVREQPTASWWQHGPYPEAFDPPPVTIIDGTTIRREGETCRLLGLKAPSDPAIAQKAKKFAEEWLTKVGKKAWVENYKDPLRDDDGALVVWLTGSIGSAHSCLNEELYTAELSEIEESKWQDYTFGALSKGGPIRINWRKRLEVAKVRREQSK